MFSRLKPDSATQVHGDLYIGTRDEEGGVFGSRKRSQQVGFQANTAENSMINFAAQDTMQPKDLHKRKTSLPEISGVNQRSLSLLID